MESTGKLPTERESGTSSCLEDGHSCRPIILSGFGGSILSESHFT